ncbi:RNA polymerase sigma factor [Arenimonas fontis]|uniref:Sigma-70 family RNA polymerase sigma factor n=1 Tax=Arenimonas fontis TaxID=2608255 RepID=A0A5B2Z940_9GAMM|nr:sigma-70 family RNA polymerase sigma factor [Arenimonas fontis]KAA2285238.1 sigma-70 family RNA polymerase sigma factor [Arenimonas fontis]
MLNLAVATDTLPPASAADASAREEDHALVRAAGAGDRHAFEALYRRHVRRVYALLWRICGHEARAEDLVQDAFVRAWQALPGFRFESAFSTWLHRLAVNTALMELRSRRGNEDLETGDEALLHHPAGDDVERAASGLELERAIATLPPRARAVLVLHDVEGWKHEEIAAELGMAVGSSKAQLHRARHLLRARLGEGHGRE